MTFKKSHKKRSSIKNFFHIFILIFPDLVPK
nr:MAG TPA: hypothetical protein [Caudoviricetes sp.]